MFWIMTDEEQRQKDDRVRALYASHDPADQIAALLMDTSVGGFGMNEEAAFIKAAAIIAARQPATSK